MRKTVIAVVTAGMALSFAAAQADDASPATFDGQTLTVQNLTEIAGDGLSSRGYDMMEMWTSGVKPADGVVEDVRHRRRRARRHHRRHRHARRHHRRHSFRTHRRHCHNAWGCHGHGYHSRRHRHRNHGGFLAGIIFGAILNEAFDHHRRY